MNAATFAFVILTWTILLSCLSVFSIIPHRDWFKNIFGPFIPSFLQLAPSNMNTI